MLIKISGMESREESEMFESELLREDICNFYMVVLLIIKKK